MSHPANKFTKLVSSLDDSAIKYKGCLPQRTTLHGLGHGYWLDINDQPKMEPHKRVALFLPDYETGYGARRAA